MQGLKSIEVPSHQEKVGVTESDSGYISSAHKIRVQSDGQMVDLLVSLMIYQGSFEYCYSFIMLTR